MKRLKTVSLVSTVATFAGALLLLFGYAERLLSAERSAPSGSSVVVQGTIWVADEYSNSITVINAATNKVVTRLTGIEAPHNLQVSPDNKSVWAVTGHPPLAVMIDAVSYGLHGSVAVGKHPAHIILTPDGKTVYVTNGDDNTVTAIDAATMKAVKTVRVGRGPHGLRPSPDGRWVYVANATDATLSVIDSANHSKAADIKVGEKPVQVGFSPDGKFVYASLNAENALAKVDVTSRKLVGKVKVGAGPIQVFVTPDNKYVLVANQGTKDKPSTTVSMIDTASFAVATTVETGKGAHGVVVEPTGTYAYVTNIYGGDVAVLDLSKKNVVAKIPTGAGPNGISFSSNSPASTSRPETKLNIGHKTGSTH
jgi:YVTN family beta-propeller protein